jgi:replicative DNA helicase
MTKQPPHALDAEQAVLGAMMADERVAFDVIELLEHDDFYGHDHKILFAALKERAQVGKTLDFIAVNDALRAAGKLEEVGGYAYVGGLAADCPSSANVMHYARIVRDKAILRQVIATGTELAITAYSTQAGDVDELLQHAERKLTEVRTRGERHAQQVRSFADPAPLIESQIEKATHNERALGVRTGFVDLDRLLKPMEPGDLIIAAGRPAMGKTSFAQNVAEFVAKLTGVPVLMFSMEMPAEQLAMRSFAAAWRVPIDDIVNGRAPIDDHFSEAGAKLRSLPVIVDDTPALTPLELRARARRLQARHGCSLIVVDHLSLMRAKAENRTQEVGVISRSLKALAKELRVPVMALCQLNRGVEARVDKRPVLSDLRESGEIEQDADAVLFVYRDEYYHGDKSPHQGIAEIIIGKQRNGRAGVSVDLTYEGPFCRFANYAGPPREQREPRQSEKKAPRRGFSPDAINGRAT